MPSEELIEETDQISIQAYKNRGGRPTKYREEYGDMIIEMARNGSSPAYWASQLGVGETTIKDWARKIPEFGAKFEIANTVAKAWWEEQGRLGINKGKQFNTGTHVVYMRNRWGYKDKMETGGDGRITVNVSIKTLPAGDKENVVDITPQIEHQDIDG